MKSLCRFLLLPIAEKWLICRSLALIVAVRIGLSIVPYSVLDRWLNTAAPLDDGKIDSAAIKRIVRTVSSCSRIVPFATCLTQALATRALLGSAGQPSELKIGVTKGRGETFGAHAWIEVDGQIVIGKLPDHQRFSVLS